MKGLAFQKTADALATFVKQHGDATPRRALFCTYDLAPARFEAVILPELARRRRWFRTLVLADAAALQKQGVLGQRSAASVYELAPVRVKGPGVFHPKLIVMQAGQRVLVGIGSGNLTVGGLGGNLELMLFATNETQDGAVLATSAIQFLHDLLLSRRVVLPLAARRFTERICLLASGATRGPVLHNLDVPLIDQLAMGRPARIHRTVVISPWHSAASTDGVEPAVLAAVGRKLGARPQVYTQGQDGLAPALGKSADVRILRTGANAEGDDLNTNSNGAEEARPRRPARLHAKAYLAVGATRADLWLGSANCTTPALCRAAGRGNVELLVHVTLGRRARARLEADLVTMFERAAGFLPISPTPRIPTPQGTVLAGYVQHWMHSPRLVIELAVPACSRSLRIGMSEYRKDSIEVAILRGTRSVKVSAEMTFQLLRGGAVPPILWELLSATAIPFPVSVPCAAATDDAEQMLRDALDELAGRVPFPFRTLGRDDNADDDSDGDEERDRELELLTASEHEGARDRIAVQVELLRRRITRLPQERSHWVRFVGELPLPVTLRRILANHLGSRG